MFIFEKPAMKIGNLLVVADLHIGITKDIRDRGIHIPSQIDALSSRLNVLKKSTKARKLVILGDVKHRIPTANWQEEREIPKFFSQLNFKNIVLLKGNHDGRIERMVPDNVKVKKMFSHGKYTFTHGHRRITTNKKFVVIGHNQPHVQFRDEMKARYTEPVWVKGPLKGAYKNRIIIMMPAFNELAGATLVNKDELLGPIAKCVDRKRAHCYLLDGTDLGVISDLRVE